MENTNDNCNCDKCDCTNCKECDCKECDCCSITEDYGKYYSKESFWDKIKKYASIIGMPILKKVFTLYYIWEDENSPLWARYLVVPPALGYFIFPQDLVPDYVQPGGYGDDLIVIGIALTAIAAHIKDEHINKADDAVNKWFNNDDKKGDDKNDDNK